MVSLEWAKLLNRQIPLNWHKELLNMTEDKAKKFATRFPQGPMELPKAPAKKKTPAKKKVAKKDK